MFKNYFVRNTRRVFFKKSCFFSEKQPNNAKNPFNERMQKIMNKEGNKTASQYLVLPGILIFGSLAIYVGWNRLPYGKMFPHFTVSEYVNQKGHLHAVFLAPLSFQTTGHLLIYLPLMAYGLLRNAKLLSSGYLLLFYGLNSVISTGVVYAYEKNYKQNRMITPKCLGGCTALSNIFCFFAMKPQYLIFGSRVLPFFLVPAIMAMYEINELNSGYINEITRPSHISSMVFGLTFGIFAKRFLVI